MSMSTRGVVPAPLCQGFLKKRKDKMVQSVREVSRSENNRYLFEITMKNGKKKMLAAETADVRQEWMDQLWKAMLLNGPDGSGSLTDGELVPDNDPEIRSSRCEESNNETSSTSVNSIDQESFKSFAVADETQDSLHTGNEMEQSTEEYLLTDCDYDVLPSRKLAEEAIYDTPPSKWSTNVGEHEVTDSIYDFPNPVIRKLTEHTIESHSSSERPESGGLLSDMIACLDSESAAWVKPASP